MELEIIRADPAGNITIFVLSPVEGREMRAAAAKALLADPALQAEQVGFVLPPDGGGHWRLEMMGGEFCGNAARNFGLYIAGQNGLKGKHTLMIEISGAGQPLPVYVDTEAGTAAVAMPGPLAETEIECAGRRFPVCVFEGITHVIAEDTEPDEELLHSLLGCFEHHPDALGVMFYDTKKRFMRPLVWVRATASTVFESSCGSGSAALGVWAARHLRDGGESLALAQPGGIIEVQVEKSEGSVRRLTIGGQVSLSRVQCRHISL
ncbi:diaminopimelate epimerase [Spirochaetia bacterium]|nr:diaminopimelate epimerase [Spirochaetia bacterium]